MIFWVYHNISNAKKIAPKKDVVINEIEQVENKVAKKKVAPKKDEVGQVENKIAIKKVIKKDVIIDEVEQSENKVAKKKVTTKKVAPKKEDVVNDEVEQTENKVAKKKVTKKKVTPKKIIQIDRSYLRVPDNTTLFELTKHDNEQKTQSQKNILSMIDRAHNILYNDENIEGENALNDIMNFIFIKCLAPIISDHKEDGKIDLLNKEYYKGLYKSDELDKIFSYFQDLNNLNKIESGDLRDLKENNDAIREMGEILKTHPMTRMIYTDTNIINAKKATTIKHLLNDVILKLDINELEQNEDVIGEIYEHIINGYVKKGSKLGQFFTPRMLMKLVLHYKEQRIKGIINEYFTGDAIKIYDSCMGTAGWLVIANNMLKKLIENRFLLSGCDISSKTFQYGLMNLILTLKEFPHDVICESSLTHINNNKHHFILTNPPFQTDKKFAHIKDNFDADEETRKNNISIDNVYKLKNNSPPMQFLELDLYKLEQNGMCIIVLPYGDMFSGSSHKKSRKYFMDKCNITDIIVMKGGIFTHTGIKTCVLIIENNGPTKEITFSEANQECNKLTKLTTITREDIEKEHNSSWFHQDYLKEPDKQITDGIEWAKICDVFTLEKGKMQSSKIEIAENGKYPDTL